MQLVSSAENSSLDWKAQYTYIEDIGDGRGYTAGIIGFCSGTGDMLDLVEAYTRTQAGQRPGQVPAGPAQRQRHRLARRPRPGLHQRLADRGRRPGVPAGAERRARPGLLQPGGTQGKADGLRALGQFAYYDAIVMHGPGGDAPASAASAGPRAGPKTPAQGGDEPPTSTPSSTRGSRR